MEVCEPRGEHEYLSRLVCPSGARPAFERKGSIGSRSPADKLSKSEEAKMMAQNLEGAEVAPGDADYHIIDNYSVTCGESTTTLYLDMYHCKLPAPDKAPEGFTLAGPPTLAEVQPEIDGFVHCSLDHATAPDAGKDAPEAVAERAMAACASEFSVLQQALVRLVLRDEQVQGDATRAAQLSGRIAAQLRASTQASVVKVLSKRRTGK